MTKRTAIASTVGVVFVGIACLLWRAVSTSLEAEKTLHAYNLTLDLIGRFVEENGGKWPESWEALATVSPKSSNMWNWPSDIDEIRKRVKIDFSLSTKSVASMRADDFKAVQQIGPQYGGNDVAVSHLIDIARSVTR